MRTSLVKTGTKLFVLMAFSVSSVGVWVHVKRQELQQRFEGIAKSLRHDEKQLQLRFETLKQQFQDFAGQFHTEMQRLKGLKGTWKQQHAELSQSRGLSRTALTTLDQALFQTRRELQGLRLRIKNLEALAEQRVLGQELRDHFKAAIKPLREGYTRLCADRDANAASSHVLNRALFSLRAYEQKLLAAQSDFKDALEATQSLVQSKASPSLSMGK